MATIPKRSERATAKTVAPKKAVAKKENPKQEEPKQEAVVFDNPESFLLHIMNNETMEVRHRLSAASSLMPYHHAKKGEIGKKEREEQKAKELAKESKFATPKPPDVVNK